MFRRTGNGGWLSNHAVDQSSRHNLINLGEMDVKLMIMIYPKEPTLSDTRENSE